MPKRRRVAVMLDLEVSLRRHTSQFAGAQKYALQHDWELIIDEYADETLSARCGNSVPYDGVIARASLKLAQRAARLRIPVVNLWFNSPAKDLLPGVFPDFAAIGRLRAEHLLTRGLSRFAALVSKTDSQDTEVKAFRDTVGEAGYPCAVTRIPLAPSQTVATWRQAQQSIAKAFDGWELPIGVYVGSESVGRHVAQLCRGRGLRVPEDVAIIAGYNEETLCVQPSPTLTSVEVGGQRIGYEGAQLLHRLMDGKSPPDEPLLLPPQGLVVRESTDLCAVKDDLVAAALAFISANAHRRIGPDAVARAVGAEVRTL